MRPSSIIILCCLVTIVTAADWPRWRGPAGGGSQPQPELDGKLVDTADQVKFVWKSEAYVEDTFTGAYSSPVLANGKVYIYFYQGDGKALQEDYWNRNSKATYRDIPEEQLAKRPSPAADEIVLCMDAKTGKTIWKFVSPSTGLNHQRENSAAHCTPCVGEGKLVVQGNTGILFCIDAESGELVWKVEHENYEEKRDHRDQHVSLRKVTGGGGMRTSWPFTAPVITDGVAVIGTRDRKWKDKRIASHWEGYDLKTGKRVWQVRGGDNGQASPVLWPHGDKNYIIGLTQCIDPRTGKQLWQLPPQNYRLHSSGTPAIDGDIIVYSGGRAHAMPPSAWKLSLTGSEKELWVRDSLNEKVNSCGSSLGAHRGVAYIHCSSGLGHRKGGYVLAIELATGKELARHMGSIGVKCTPSVVAMADRVIFPMLSGGFKLFGVGTDFKYRGTFKYQTGFAKAVTPAVADGYVYSRGKDGMYCFSLLR